LGGEARLALRLPQFADDLGPRALRPLLLGYCVEGARQLSLLAVAARVDAATFDLATMAGVAGPLDSLRHGVGGASESWADDRGNGEDEATQSTGGQAKSVSTIGSRQVVPELRGGSQWR